jgi:hypothetical protein
MTGVGAGDLDSAFHITIGTTHITVGATHIIMDIITDTSHITIIMLKKVIT